MSSPGGGPKALFCAPGVDKANGLWYNEPQVRVSRSLEVERIEMNVAYLMAGILGLLLGIMLVRIISHGDSAKSYVLQSQAF